MGAESARFFGALGTRAARAHVGFDVLGVGVTGALGAPALHALVRPGGGHVVMLPSLLGGADLGDTLRQLLFAQVCFSSSGMTTAMSCRARIALHLHKRGSRCISETYAIVAALLRAAACGR